MNWLALQNYWMLIAETEGIFFLIFFLPRLKYYSLLIGSQIAFITQL